MSRFPVEATPEPGGRFEGRERPEDGMASSGAAEAETLRVLVSVNKALQNDLEAKLEAVQKEREENAMWQRKMSQTQKSLNYKDQVAQGLEVVWHQEKKTLVVPREDGCVGVPASRYFVSKNGTVPKPNDDSVLLADFYHRMPIPFEPRPWGEGERERLRSYVKEVVVTLKQNRALAKQGEPSTSDFLDQKESLLQDWKRQRQALEDSTSLLSDEDRELLREVDWDKAAKRVGNDRDPQECHSQWTYVEDPFIPKCEFSVAEGEKLMDIAKDNEMRDWEKVARDLAAADIEGSGDPEASGTDGTKRKFRAIDCLTYFQKNRKRRHVVCKWTSEEDAALADQAKTNEDWNKWVGIAATFEGKTAKQCLQQWKILKGRAQQQQQQEEEEEPRTPKKPKKDRSAAARERNPWTDEEDKILCDEVKAKGKKWCVVAQALANKTDRQCRERFLLVNPDLKKGEWSSEEIMTMYRNVCAYANSHDGHINWDFVGRQMNRSSNHCRKRWNRLFESTFTKVLRDVVREFVAEAKAEPATWKRSDSPAQDTSPGRPRTRRLAKAQKENCT